MAFRFGWQGLRPVAGATLGMWYAPPMRQEQIKLPAQCDAKRQVSALPVLLFDCTMDICSKYSKYLHETGD